MREGLEPAADELIARLEADDLVRREGPRLRATRRWQGAMARAALRLQSTGDAGEDLRMPVAFALVEIYGDDAPDELLATMVEALLPIVIADLDPRAQLPRAGGPEPSGG